VKDKREFRVIGVFRWWYLLLLGAALLLLASFYLDAGAQAWMTGHQNPGVRRIMQAVSRYGDWPEHVALGILLLVVAYFRRNKKWMRIFAAMIVACALAGIATRVVKISTGRSRPSVQTESSWNGPQINPRYNAFPSGHTAASTAFFATLAFASWRVGLAFLFIPLLVAFSRMYVAAHHLSDVVCAAMIGAMAAYVVVGWKPLQLRNRKSEIRN
jgi:membrane-associated phospholipid phosphatase